MQIPAAMMIESAIDNLPKLDPRWRNDQIKELDFAMGTDKAEKLGLTFPLSKEAQVAYCLGLETARVVIAMDMQVRMKGLDPETIL